MIQSTRHLSGSTQYQTYFAVCHQHFSQLQRAMVTLAWHDQIHLMSWYSGKDWPEACLSISYYSPPTASPTLGTFMLWPSLKVWYIVIVRLEMKLLSNKNKKRIDSFKTLWTTLFQPNQLWLGKKVKCPTQRKKLKLRNHSKVFDTSLVDIFKKVSSDEPCHVFFPRPPVTGFPKEGEVTEKTPGK